MINLNLQEEIDQDSVTVFSNKYFEEDTMTGLWKRSIGTPINNFNSCNTPAVFHSEPVNLINTITTIWLTNEDAFTQAELLNSEYNKVHELIFRIRKSISIQYGKYIADRLLTLYNDEKEEDLTSLGIAVDSLRNFYNFMQLHPNTICPDISLSPEYNIYISWRDNQKQLFSVHFLPNDDVRFVVFRENKRHPEQKIRLSGVATCDILIETIAPLLEIEWIFE